MNIVENGDKLVDGTNRIGALIRRLGFSGPEALQVVEHSLFLAGLDDLGTFQEVKQLVDVGSLHDGMFVELCTKERRMFI